MALHNKLLHIRKSVIFLTVFVLLLMLSAGCSTSFSNKKDTEDIDVDFIEDVDVDFKREIDEDADAVHMRKIESELELIKKKIERLEKLEMKVRKRMGNVKKEFGKEMVSKKDFTCVFDRECRKELTPDGLSELTLDELKELKEKWKDNFRQRMEELTSSRS